MKMFNPPHPGLIIREDVLPDLGLSVTGAAAQLGVSRVALSRVINGRAAISADMAIRFAQWLGGSAETWLHAQAQFDLWQAGRGKRIKVKPVQRAVVVPATLPGRKRSIHSGQSGNLTPSEAASLKADFKRGYQEIDRIIASDPKRGRPQPA